MAFYAGRVDPAPGDGRTRRSSCSPTATTSTTSSSAPSRAAATCCASRRCRPPTGPTCARSSRSPSGGVVFTTIQKFFPEEKGDRHPVLSERRNIVVIADEAHRSQYDFIDGFARHMRDALPHASFIGFTGTPIEKTDANTRAVFGDYISVYDIQRAVRRRRDGADLLREPAGEAGAEGGRAAEDRPGVRGGDRGRGGRAQGEAQEPLGAARGGGRRREPHQAHRRATWSSTSRSGSTRWTARRWSSCMSRRICVELYREIVALRPEWHGDDDEHGALKVVMTGSASDPLDWQPHIRSKARREDAGGALPRPDRPVPDRDRARHVAHRLRRAEPAHDVRRQADARPRADAGHRAREPGVQGQAGRAGRRLPRPRRRAEAGARDLHRERAARARRRSTRPRPWR